MKIIIFSPTSTVLSLQPDQPLGGADSALLRMIDVLSEHNQVYAYIPVKERCFNYRLGAFIYPYMDLFNTSVDCDLLIVYRKVWAIPNTVIYKKAVFWSQDLNDTPCFSGVKDREFFKKIYDNVVVLSKFHKENFKESFDFPEEKFIIIGNASGDYYVDVRNKKRNNFIYMSTPFRGLVVLMKMWKKIIERYPDATLEVFSSMKIYGGDAFELQFQGMYDKLKSMKGVTYHGSKSHREVIEALSNAYMLLYPNTYPETYCNVINEARACKTPFITSHKGALPETGGIAGMYINGNPYTEEYQKQFLDAVFTFIENEKIYQRHQEMCLPCRNWDNFNDDVLNMIKRLKCD